MKEDTKTKEQLLLELEGLRKRIDELEKSDAERKQLSVRLQDSEARWRSLVENAADLILTTDREGTVLFMNRTPPGLTVQEVIGKSVYNYIEPEHWDMVKAAVADVFSTGNPDQYEIWARGPHNTLAWYSTRVAPVMKDGAVTAVSVIARDITEHKRTEERLSEYHKVVESLNDMIAIVDRNYTYVLANNALLRNRNMSSEQVVGRSVPDVLGRDIFEQVIRPHLDSCFQGNTIRYEMKYQYPELGERDLLVSYLPIGEAGQVTRAASVISDITEDKRAERALKEAHEKLQATLRAVPDLMFEVDREGRIYDYHAPEHETLYVGPEAFLGKTVAEVLPESTAGVILQAIADADDHGWHRGATYSLDLPGGGRQYFELSIDVKKTGIAQKRFVALARNITKRKLAEEALRKSEKQYRDLVDNSPVGIYKSNVKGDILFANEALARMAGYDSPADLMKEGVLATYKRGSDRNILLKNLREQGKISNFEFEFVRKNGETIRAILSAVLEGEMLSGMILDITERKQAEEERERLILELRDALAKIKTLSGLLPICSWCKKIRNDGGYWQQIEAYIHDHSDAQFTHGICPDCVKKMYSERKK